MFLKHYEGLSDAKIIENLNLNIAYQLFSGVVLAEGECIKDLTLLSSWRT
ncbi:DDE transposase, partial [Emticicia sp. ODNR4P]|nr:DDE transposase [Emticicia sp. ODNR4P]